MEDGQGKRDLIGRLLDEPVETPPEAASRQTASAEQPEGLEPPPSGATFLVHDDWDASRSVPRPIEGVATGARTLRRRLDDATPTLLHVGSLAIFALAVVGAIGGLLVAWYHLTSDPIGDARAYYNAAARLNAGEPLYPPGQDVNSSLVYYYPPLLAIVLRPFALLPWAAFAVLWETVVVGSFGLLLHRLGVRPMRTWIVVGLLGIPIGWALPIGQVQMPMVLLLAIGQPWSIALAANFKLFPALAVVWWIGRRDLEATIAFVLVAGLLALVQLILEPTGSFEFLRTVGLAEVGQVRNISPYAASPELWGILLVVGIAAALALARTRWGWPAAVALATLSPPRLIVYALSGLLAAVREPEIKHQPEREPRPWQWVVGSRR